MGAGARFGRGKYPRVRIAIELLVAAPGIALLAWAWWADRAWCARHLFLFLGAREDEVSTGAAFRYAAVATGLVVVLVACPLAGRWAKDRAPTEALSTLARYAVALALALVVSEVGLRVLGLPQPRTTGARGQSERRLAQRDARYGWSYVPSRTTVIETAGRPVKYAVDANGDRAREDDLAIDPSQPTLLFAGESIAVGHGLSWSETYAGIAGERLGLQVVNVAVHGYGSDQAFLRTSDALSKLERPVAVVTFFLPLMISRIANDDHPRLVLGQEGQAPSTTPVAGFFHDLRLAEVVRAVFPFRSDNAIEAGAAAIRETARIAHARGARAIFLCPNLGYGASRGDEWALDYLFTQSGLTCLDVDIGGETLAGDTHPSARAIRVLADALVVELGGLTAR